MCLSCYRGHERKLTTTNLAYRSKAFPNLGRKTHKSSLTLAAQFNGKHRDELQRCADEFLQIDVALVVHLFVDADGRAVVREGGRAFQNVEEFLFRPFGMLFVF